MPVPVSSVEKAFVWLVSFAKPGETITFAEALAAARRLVGLVYREESS
jgi:hypothetical protein